MSVPLHVSTPSIPTSPTTPKPSIRHNPIFPNADPLLNGLTLDDIDVTNPETPDVLMFIIHGMGRQSWLGRNINNTRKTIASLVSDPRIIKNRILSIPIEYHSKLHAKTHVKVDSIKLSTCSALRNVINDFAVDPLYYYTPEHGKFVRDEVTGQLNTLYTTFLASHQDFDGEVTILSHSMGGLIMWDILNYSTSLQAQLPPASDLLLLPIKRVFCLGSPISNALVLRGHEPYMYTYRIPFINLHHPHDPVAYRFEPLFDPMWQHVPSVQVHPYSPLASDTSWMLTSTSTSIHRRFVAALPNFSVPNVPPPISDLSSVVSNGMRSLVASVLGASPSQKFITSVKSGSNDSEDGYDSDNEWDAVQDNELPNSGLLESFQPEPQPTRRSDSPRDPDSQCSSPSIGAPVSPPESQESAIQNKRRRLNSPSIIQKSTPHRPPQPDQPDILVTTAATIWAMFMGVYNNNPTSSSASTSPAIRSSRKRKRSPQPDTEGDATVTAFKHLLTSDHRPEEIPVPDVPTPTSQPNPSLETLPFGFRLDYVLPVSNGSTRIRHMDLANEYLSGLRAHFDYWDSRDAIWFVVCALNGFGPAGTVLVNTSRNQPAGKSMLGDRLSEIVVLDSSSSSD